MRVAQQSNTDLDAPLIVQLDRETMGHVDIPRPDAPHRWIEYGNTAPDEIVARLQGAQVAVINKVKFGEAVFAQLPELKLIAVTATGTDVIDAEAARAHGVSVRNVAGYGSTSVAEHVVMLIFALSRGLISHRDSVIDGTWERGRDFCVFASPVRDVTGLRLGLVGSGAIAQGVASRAQALGMDVVFAGRRGKPAGEGKIAFEEMLATSDVVSLHCPLNAETQHMFDAPTFAAMKKGAILINTARGGLVELDALEAALDAGTIAGAGLDVAPVEPPPPGSAILRLAKRSDVIVTPHSAWSSDAAMRTLAQGVSCNIADFLAGA